MKKLILKESQLKRIVNLIISEQANGEASPSVGQKTSEDSWYLCGYDIIKIGSDYFAETRNGESFKLPLASKIIGTIQDGDLAWDDDVINGLEMGMSMKNTIACQRTMPMQYAGATTNGNGGSWFLFIDDSMSRYKEPTPVYSIMTWNGSLRVVNPDTPLDRVKEKEGNEIQYNVSRSKSFVIEISPAMAGRKYIPTEEKPKPNKPEFENINLDIQSPFEFDKTTLTPEAEVEFKKFIEKVKANYQGVSGNVEVISSASIDADENQKREYNQKLSDNRAATIANRLKTETGITSLNFIPKGIGQTDQFAKGMKFPEVKDTNKTAPNRRLIIKMPQITKQKQ